MSSADDPNTGEGKARERDEEQHQKEYAASRKGKTKEQLEKEKAGMSGEELARQRDYDARMAEKKKEKTGGEK